MQLLNTTYRSQSALANYCRTGKYTSLKGVNRKNISQYRRLVFNVVEEMLQSAYPLTYGLLFTKEWRLLTKEFFSNHPCSSPQVWYMPKEFYEYISTTNHPLLEKYPYLLELLWFEWLEIELYMMADKKVSHSLIVDIHTDQLILNPESHFQHFQYPIHLKQAKYITTADRADYFLTIHREPENGNVLLTSVSPALLRMLELLSESPSTLVELTQNTCSELNISYTEQILKTTREFANKALETKLIIGFASPM